MIATATENVLSVHLISIDQSTHRLIRLTSPKLNYIIGAGAVLLYLGITVMVIPSTDPNIVKVLCNVSLYVRHHYQQTRLLYKQDTSVNNVLV